MNPDIHPIFGRTIGRQSKEALLGQRGKVIWLTGLSGSGKSTLAIGLERRLHDEGVATMLLDGDNLRTGLCKDLGFSEADREENIRRIAEVARLFCQAGIVTLASFISPTRHIRGLAAHIVGEADFLEVYVNASLETCESRDVKGLYKKARAGQIPDFTGIHSPFEAPETPFLEVRTDEAPFEACLETLFMATLPVVRPTPPPAR